MRGRLDLRFLWPWESSRKLGDRNTSLQPLPEPQGPSAAAPRRPRQRGAARAPGGRTPGPTRPCCCKTRQQSIKFNVSAGTWQGRDPLHGSNFLVCRASIGSRFGRKLVHSLSLGRAVSLPISKMQGVRIWGSNLLRVSQGLLLLGSAACLLMCLPQPRIPVALGAWRPLLGDTTVLHEERLELIAHLGGCQNCGPFWIPQILGAA